MYGFLFKVEQIAKELDLAIQEFHEELVLMSNNIKNDYDHFLQNCSARLKHCIQNNNCFSFDQVLSYTRDEWLRVPNFGKQCLRELEFNLKVHGFRLRSK